MWLLRKVSKGKSIHNPLGTAIIPDEIDSDILISLVKQLRNGDTSVIDKIINGHIKLAISIACRYVSQQPRYVDDIISEAMQGLTIAVKDAPKKLKDDCITPWIVTNVHRYIHDFLSKNNIFYIPQSTIYRKHKKGESIKIPKVFPIQENNTTKDQKVKKKDSEIVSSKEEDVRDIMETINAAIWHENDRRKREIKQMVISLRANGYNDREIAEMLDLSISYVQRMRAEVELDYELLRWR
jgi:DNA-directed RNA polymerase specialized sigma subunit